MNILRGKKCIIRYYAEGRNGSNEIVHQEAYVTQAIGTSSTSSFLGNYPGYLEQKITLKGGLSGTTKECIGTGIICER